MGMTQTVNSAHGPKPHESVHLTSLGLEDTPSQDRTHLMQRISCHD